MILEESRYFGHSGVKGMRWGVRKQRKAEAKAAKQEAKAKADREYGDAVANLVSGAAKRGSLVSMRVNNKTTIMTGNEAAQMILKNNGQIPRNAMWNEIELAK